MRIKPTLLSLATAMAFITTQSSVADDVMVVKIGHVGPLTGSSAHLGKDNENGARMAIDELNAKNTLIGGKKVKFELISEDDASDPQIGNAVAQKLVAAKVNGVVGHLNSNTSIPAAKIYHDGGIPQISPSSTATAYTNIPNYRSTFRVVANDAQIGSKLGRYAVQKLNARNIATLDDRTAYGQSIADELINGAKKGALEQNIAIKLINREYTTDKTADITTILTRIKEGKPDVIFFGGVDSAAGPILKQMKALKINAKFIGGDGICTSTLPKLSDNSMADGQVICAEAGGITNERRKLSDDFRAAYKKKYASDVVIYAPYAYDAVMTFADAMVQAKSADPAVYLPFLQNIHHKGVTGNIAFDKKGDIIDGTMTMFTFRGGKREELGVTMTFLGSALPTETTVVKIGHVGPISGPSAHLGKDNENGAKMAIDDLNAANIIIGNKKAQFELVAEDDGSDPKQGTAVAQKLVDAKVNGVVGHLNSSTSIPAAKIYHDAGIPQISPSSTATAYTNMGYKSTFRVVANDGQLGGTLGKYAVQKLNAKTLAVIDDRTAYGQGVAEEFIKGAKRQNPTIKIANRQYTSDKATDFNAILTKIKESKPDVIFFGGMDSVAGPMLRQMKALNINAKFMGGDGICTTTLPKLAGDSMADGQVICAEAGGVTSDQKKSSDDFRVAYKKKFGVDVIIYAPYVYDAVMTLADAMQQAKSTDPAVYLPYLQKINHDGITGDIAFDKKGDIKDGALTMYTYKAGKRDEIGVVK